MQRMEDWMLPPEKKKPPRPMQAAAIAGFVGALLLFAIQLGLQTLARGDAPLGTMFATKVLGLRGLAALLAGTFSFCLAGAFWGALYAALVEKIAAVSGLLFGFAPWLVTMLVMLPIVGRPVFAGGEVKKILLWLALSLLWGAFVGASTPSLNKPRLAA